MIFFVLSGDRIIPFPTLLVLTFLFLLCGTLMAWLHNVIECLVSGQSVRGQFRALWKDPNTYLSVICFAVFGVGWYTTVSNRCQKRGKRFLLGSSGLASGLLISLISVIMINITSKIIFLYLFFKILFRVSAFGSLFSLMPLIPYDGGQILFSVLPSRWQEGFLKSKDFSMIVMIAAVLVLTVLGKIPPMAL